MLVRHRFKPTLAAGLVVLGLLVLMAGVVVATVRGVTEQTDEISASVDKALDKAADQTDALGIDEDALDDGPEGNRRRRPGRSRPASSPASSPASAPWSPSPAA